jgi:hypothetical protein
VDVSTLETRSCVDVALDLEVIRVSVEASSSGFPENHWTRRSVPLPTFFCIPASGSSKRHRMHEHVATLEDSLMGV